MTRTQVKKALGKDGNTSETELGTELDELEAGPQAADQPAGPSAQPAVVGRELPQLQQIGALDDIRRERLAAERKQKAAETDETRAQKQRAKNLAAMARLEREERELAHNRRALAWGLLHNCDPVATLSMGFSCSST